MRDVTNETIYLASIADLFAAPPTAASHLTACDELLADAQAAGSAPDLCAAVDTLRAAVVELHGIVREQSGQIAGLLDLIEARDAQAGAA